MIVTKKQAEYLKELGFNTPILKYYILESQSDTAVTQSFERDWNVYSDRISAPTLIEAMDWIEDKFNIAVSLTRYSDRFVKENPKLVDDKIFCNIMDNTKDEYEVWDGWFSERNNARKTAFKLLIKYLREKFA